MKRGLAIGAACLAACGPLPWGSGVKTAPPPKAQPVDNGLVLALSPKELAHAAGEVSEDLAASWDVPPEAMAGSLLVADPTAPAEEPVELSVSWGGVVVTPGTATLAPLGTSMALELGADLAGALLEVGRPGWPSCALTVGPAALSVHAEIPLDSDKVGQIKAPITPSGILVRSPPDVTHSTCWTLAAPTVEQVVEAWLESVGKAFLIKAAAEISAGLPAALGLEVALGVDVYPSADGAASPSASLWVRAPEAPYGNLVSNVDGTLVVPYSVLWAATQHPCVPALEPLSGAKKPLPSVALGSGTVMVSLQVIRQAVRVLWKTGALCGDRVGHDLALADGVLTARVWPEGTPTVDLVEGEAEASLTLDTGKLGLEVYGEVEGARVRLVTFEVKAKLAGAVWADEELGVHWELATSQIEATVRQPGFLPTASADLAREVVEALVVRLVDDRLLWRLPPLPGPGALPKVAATGGYLLFAR